MTARGFCYPSPPSGEPKAGLRDAQIALLHNAWPQLANYTALDRAWTQPLIRAWYMPLDPEELRGLTQDRPLLRHRVAVVHELAHFFLDSTPAKELARLFLAQAYDALHDLIAMPADTDEEALREKMARLSELDRRVSAIAGQTSLAEELLATAFSFHGEALFITRSSRPDRERKQLAGLEKRWVGSLASEVAGFADYYHDFHRIAELFAAERSPSFSPLRGLTRLSIYLEEVLLTEGGQLAVMDSSISCAEVVECVRTGMSGQQLSRWLGRAIRSNRAGMAGWQCALQDVILRHQYGPAMSRLWPLASRRALNYMPRDPTMVAQRTQRRLISRRAVTPVSAPNAMLYPQEDHGRLVITPTLAPQYEAHREVLVWEGLREQLAEHLGFKCPLFFPNTNNRCICDNQPELKERIVRLVNWGVDGKLGPGRWTRLPRPCGDSDD